MLFPKVKTPWGIFYSKAVKMRKFTIYCIREGYQRINLAFSAVLWDNTNSYMLTIFFTGGGAKKQTAYSIEKRSDKRQHIKLNLSASAAFWRTTRWKVIEVFGGCLSVPPLRNVKLPANTRGDPRDKFGSQEI